MLDFERLSYVLLFLGGIPNAQNGVWERGRRKKNARVCDVRIYEAVGIYGWSYLMTVMTEIRRSVEVIFGRRN